MFSAIQEPNEQIQTLPSSGEVCTYSTCNESYKMRITETLKALGATVSEASFSIKDDSDGKQYRQKLDVATWSLFESPDVLAAAIATASEPAKVSHKDTGLSAKTESHLLGASISKALTGTIPSDLITPAGRSKLRSELLVIAAKEAQSQRAIASKLAEEPIASESELVPA